MALFVPTTGQWDTDIADNLADRYWKILVDTDDDEVLEDVTSNVILSSVAGGANKDGVGQWRLNLRNSAGTYDEGDFAGAMCAVQAKVESEAYVTIFTGFVSEKGCYRTKRSLSEDTVELTFYDRVKGKKITRATPGPEIWQGFDICDTASVSTSIIHQLAAFMGLSSSDLDVDDIAYTVPYVAIDGKTSAWRELKKVAAQYLARPLCFRYDGKLRFFSRFGTAWAEPTSEWTIEEDVNLHWWRGGKREKTCTRARTAWNEYESLSSRTIYKNTEEWDSATSKNAIVVSAGDYWPGPGATDKARLRYKDPASGEQWALGTSIQTPTIGADGSGSDIECDGGTLTLVSFNGSTGDTVQNADSSEIILLNDTGGDITITKLEVRGTPHRIAKKHEMREVDATVTEEEEHVDKTIDGTYAASNAQSHITTQWEVDWGKEPRTFYECAIDWLPQIQVGAVVSFVVDTEGISATCYVESYTHKTGKTMRGAYTEVTIVVKESFTESGSGQVIEENEGGSTEAVDEISADVVTAQSTADSKNTIFVQAAEPTAISTDDYWIDTDDDNHVYSWDGSAWVDSDRLQASVIVESMISDNAVTTTKIVDDAIIAAKIATGAVDTDQLATDAVTTAKIVADAITETLILAGAVTEGKIATDAVTTTKIIDDAIVAAKIATGAVGETQIATDAVTTTKIIDDALTAAKVNMADWMLMTDEGLVAYWPLNDAGLDVVDYQHKDVSGNEHHATANELLTAAEGPAGPCVDLDGTQHLTVTDHADINFGAATDFSISVWVKLSAISAVKHVIDKRDTAVAAGGKGYDLALTDAGVPYWIMGDGTNYVNGSSGSKQVDDDAWHQIAVVCDRDGNATIYVDGVTDGVVDISAIGDCDHTTDLTIGRQSYATSGYLPGSLAHVRIFSRALSQNEVRYLYANPSGNIPGLVLADRAAFGSVLAENLNVLARDLVNNVSESKHLGGWGLHDDYGRDRSGTSHISLVDGTYETETVKAMRILADDTWGVRCKTWRVDHDAIYRVSIVAEQSAGSTSTMSFGLSAFTSAEDGTEDDDYLPSTEDVERWTAATGSRTLAATTSNVYFSASVQPSTPTTYMSYIVGANRSVDECPDVETATSIARLKPTTTHVALRVLRMSAEAGASYDVFFPTAQRIGSGTIVAENILAEAITAAKIAAGAITTEKLDAGAVTADEIGANAVTTAKIDAGAVTATEIATDAVIAAKIAAGAVVAGKIAANAVTATTIATGAVEADKIDANAVTTVKLAAGAVTANEIATDAVTAAKILAGAVEAAKMAAENFFFTKAVGSENRATPSSGDVRAYLGKDPDGDQDTADTVELAIKEYNGENWEERFRAGMRSGGNVADAFVSGFFEAGESVLSSPGLIWNRQTLPEYSSSTTTIVRGVAYGNGTIVVVGNFADVGNPSEPLISYSTDGGVTFAAWLDSSDHSFTAGNILGCVEGKGGTSDVFFAGGQDGEIAKSTDGGATWGSLITYPHSGSIREIKYISGTTWIAVGGSSGGEIARSTDDGASWSSVTEPFTTNRVYDVAVSGVYGVAVGGAGTIAYSSDSCASWTLVSSSPFTTTSVYSIAYGDGVWIAAGVSGKLSRSIDNGVTWSTLIDIGFSTSDIGNVDYAEGVFIAGGASAKIARSADGGVTWGSGTYSSVVVSQPFGTAGYFVGLDYDEEYRRWVIGGYLTADNSGILATSDWLEAGSGIVEQGESTDGYYVRFSSGLQLCWHSLAQTPATLYNHNIGTYGWSRYGGSVTWSFPVAFYDASSVSVVGSNGGGATVIGTPGTTSVTVGAVNISNTAITHLLVAAGYWK